MKFLFLIIIAAFSFSICDAQSKTVPVFTSGAEGHKSYRIPALISLPNGELLAFAEGRVHSSGDFGDINIVMKVYLLEIKNSLQKVIWQFFPKILFMLCSINADNIITGYHFIKPHFFIRKMTIPLFPFFSKVKRT